MERSRSGAFGARQWSVRRTPSPTTRRRPFVEVRDNRRVRDQVSVVETVEAAADVVYDMVSDLCRMGDWSPESVGGRWLRGGGPLPGARFVGHNRSARRRWSTLVTVTVAERPRCFAFRVSAPLIPIAHWEYRIEPTERGCRVEETWTDRRWLPVRFVSKLRTGIADRSSFNREAMRQTLAALKVAAEAKTAA